MTHVSLFTGIGGIDLAADWAGFRTVAQVERDSYCLKVLEKHWPGVHRCREIRDFPDQDYGAVTLVSGGFPCQPFSAAGKRRGKEDDRYLWPEMLRVIQAVKPTWVLAENVPGILTIESGMVFESVLADLETAGYETWTGLIPAAGAGAPHYRYRVFIVAHSDGRGLSEPSICPEQQGRAEIIGTGQDVANTEGLRGLAIKRDESDGVLSADVGNTNKSRLQGYGQHGECTGERTTWSSGWWSIEPDVGRVASRIPHRVDRLRALGNAVVPQQVYPILKAIADTENQLGGEL